MFIKRFVNLQPVFILIMPLLFGTGCAAWSQKPFVDQALLRQSDLVPFDEAWAVKDADWTPYTELIIKPINVDRLKAQTWWQEWPNKSKKETLETFSATVYRYFSVAFINDERARFRIVGEPGPETLIAEIAIAEIIPSRQLLEKEGISPETIAAEGAEVPEFANIKMEVRLRDGASKKILAQFTDTETRRKPLLRFRRGKTLTLFDDIVEQWADDLVELSHADPGEVFRKSNAWEVVEPVKPEDEAVQTDESKAAAPEDGTAPADEKKPAAPKAE